MDDRGLIEEFARTGSEAAFEALVGRYLPLVYGVARRQVGEHQGAEDVTQAVFALLAKKAKGFDRRAVLAGWLFQTTVYAAANVTKRERRRRFHEMALGRLRMREMAIDGEEEREPQMRALDEGMRRLRGREREALLLRYYRQMSMAQVAGAMRISEGAAKKRVERAVGKLRMVMGVTGAAAPMVAAMVAGLGVVGAKSGEAVAAGALMSAKGTAGTETVGLIMKGALKMMYLAKLKVAAMVTVAAIVMGGAGVMTVQRLAASDVIVPVKEVVPEAEYAKRRDTLEVYAVRMRQEAEAFRRKTGCPATRERWMAELERAGRSRVQVDEAAEKVMAAQRILGLHTAEQGANAAVVQAAERDVMSAREQQQEFLKRNEDVQAHLTELEGDYVKYQALDRRATAAEMALEEMELKHILGNA